MIFICLNRTLVILGLVAISFHEIDAQVLEYSTDISFDGTKLTTQKSYLVQVNRPDERSKGEIGIPHGDEDNFKVLYAEIIDKTGKVIRKIKKKDILTRSRFSSSTFYEDSQVTEISLFSGDYPYQIRYAYETQITDFTYLTYWTPPIHHEYTPNKSLLQINLPKELEVAIESSPEFIFTEEIENDSRLLTWQLNKMQIANQENYSANLLERIPSVLVAPELFHYGVDGSLSNWTNYGDWFLDLNANVFDLTENEKRKVDELIRDLSGTREKVEILYHYLQDNTTYVNVSIDLGGLQSYPASYVCENKYGDCKALTTYMKALLDYAGITSNYVLIDAGEGRYTDGWIEEKIPGPQFNHIILGVPLESDTVWLENTSSTIPMDYVGTFIQNRKALWITSGKSTLIDMPKLSVDEVLNATRFDFVLDEKGSGSGAIHYTYQGESFENWASIKTSVKKSDIEQLLRRNINSSTFSLKEWELISTDRNRKSIQMKLSGVVTDKVRKIGRVNAIKTPAINVPEFTHPAERKTDVKIRVPIHEQITSNYNLAAFGTVQVQALQPFMLETDYGKYLTKATLSETSVVVEEQFILKSGYYPLDEYPKFYAFMKSVYEQQKKLGVVFRTN
ncbi:MAG: DUF3857 domain-containing protein [Bacteroidota bacterium]